MTQLRFILTPVGSSGDVHPFVAVGAALRARGHDVVVVTGEPFRAVIERAGLRTIVTHSTEEFDELSADPTLWHPRRGLKLVLRATASAIRKDYDAIASVYEPGRSVLVGHTLGFATRLFEERHGAPAATIQLAPSTLRTDYRQPAVTPGYDLAGAPRLMKRALWCMVDRIAIDPHVLPELNRFRRDLGLPRVSRVFASWIHSPQRVIGLFPDWFAPWQPDWPPQLRLTGFPLYDERDQHDASPDLEAFLAAGDPPVLFTPGSANRTAAPFFAAAADAAQRLGRRALLLTRYSAQLPAALPPNVRHESYVPFSLVLPRCAAIVHHGGIGTCAQGLAAGVPQVTMPLGFDQPDNTTRLWKLGVARWVAPRQFTGPRVARVLAALLDDGRVASACRRWADAMRRARPVEETCDLLEAVMPASSPTGSLPRESQSRGAARD